MKELISSINAFKQHVHESLGHEYDARQAVAASVALAVASKALLPTEAVGSPKDWYIQSVYPTVAQQVEAINEKYVLPVQMTLDLARDIWELRYCTVHDPMSTAAVNGLLHVLASQPVEVSEAFQKIYASNVKHTLSFLQNAIVAELC